MQTFSSNSFLGFGIQASKGTAASIDYYVPLIDTGETLIRDRHTRPIRQLNKRISIAGMWDAYTSWSGTIVVPILADASYLWPLLQWNSADPVSDRDATTRQASYATIIVQRGSLSNGRLKACIDAKVARTQFVISKGRPIIMRMDVIARAEPAATPTIAENVPTTAPYVYRHANMWFDINGTLYMHNACEHFELVIDQRLERPIDGCRLVADDVPVDIANLNWGEASGVINRASEDNILKDAYDNGDEVDITTDLWYDASNRIRIDVYRCRLITGTKYDTSGSVARHVDEYTFVAQPDSSQGNRCYKIYDPTP